MHILIFMSMQLSSALTPADVTYSFIIRVLYISCDRALPYHLLTSRFPVAKATVMPLTSTNLLLHQTWRQRHVVRRGERKWVGEGGGRGRTRRRKKKEVTPPLHKHLSKVHKYNESSTSLSVTGETGSVERSGANRYVITVLTLKTGAHGLPRQGPGGAS